MRWKLPACVIRAAPTCTLWRADFLRDVLVFRPWPRLVVTAQDYMEARRA